MKEFFKISIFTNKLRIFFWFLANILGSFLFTIWINIFCNENIPYLEVLNNSYVILINAFLFSFLCNQRKKDDIKLQIILPILNAISLFLVIFIFVHIFNKIPSNLTLYFSFGALFTSFLHFCCQEYYSKTDNVLEGMNSSLNSLSQKNLAQHCGGREA